MGYFLLSVFSLIGLLIGYFCGSISWAVIVTKYVFHVDIYKVGSGNAGGTNVGRACGKKAAISVIVLDVFKCLIPMWIVFLVVTYSPISGFLASFGPAFNQDVISIIYYATGFGASLGHVFPIYYHFRGGKAVSCFGGFVLGTNWLLAAIGLSIFLLVLAIRKRVSLSSIIGTILTLSFTALFATADYFNPSYLSFSFWFLPGPKLAGGFAYLAFTILIGLMVLILHHQNVHRLVNHVEPETHFLKKGEKPVSTFEKK